VLVVEDVDTTRRRICSALRAGGYQVEEAENGLAGWRRLSASRFDAVLLDLVLPQLDGWKFRQMQLDDPDLADIPTLIVTARPLREPDRYALRVRGVIQKPFEDEALVATVANAVVTAQADPAPAPRAARGADGRSATELFWSRRGEVACGVHVPPPASERWVNERWAAIPPGAGRDRVSYQCQHCLGGPIGHRSMERKPDPAPQVDSDAPPPIDTAPRCPRCQQPMLATERIPKHPDTLQRAHLKNPETVRLAVPVWRCSACGIARARFE
jgi:two-component system response regulator